MLKKVRNILIIVLLLHSFLFAETKKISAEKSESSITYQLTHPLHEIESTSRDANCIIDVDVEHKKISDVAVQVDVTTFNSGNSNRDSHAMEVIEALFYPDSRFSSTSVEQKGDSILVKGELTFHGVTKEITIHAKPDWTNELLTVSGKFNISLTEFKIERPALLLIPVEDTLRFSLVQKFPLN